MSTSGTLVGGENAPLYSWAINGYAPDGNVLSMTDSVMGAWSYTYDDMNRLVSGSASAGSMSGLNLGWNYDRYGNRWNQNASGSGSAVQTHFTFSGNNNRIDQYSSNYDADGNLKGDGVHTYTYDAENRITTLNGQPMYIYDAEGKRVAKLGAGGAVSAVYILGAGGQQITEINASGQWAHSNVFASGGRLLATYEGPGGTAAAGYHYHLTDWLGTNRLQTNASGNEDEKCVSYPFGDGLSCNGPSAIDATEQHFTGKERDAESGLDYFGARYLSSNFGRFMTPDWAAAPASVPYAKFGDPQSLNLYAYVRNNPNTGIDLDGHFISPENGVEEDQNEAETAEAQAGDIYSAAGVIAEEEGQDGDYVPEGPGSDDSSGYSATKDVKTVKVSMVDTITVTADGAPPLTPEQISWILSYVNKNDPRNTPHTALAGGISIPTPIPGLIFEIPFAYVPSTGTTYIGLGGGIGTPGVNAGLVYSEQNIENVLFRWSVSASTQAGPYGVQIIGNSSGYAVGNSMGTPGFSGTVSYSWRF